MRRAHWSVSRVSSLVAGARDRETSGGGGGEMFGDDLESFGSSEKEGRGEPPLYCDDGAMVAFSYSASFPPSPVVYIRGKYMAETAGYNKSHESMGNGQNFLRGDPLEGAREASISLLSLLNQFLRS